jgi:Lrp/AsnC family transcriptional regulator, leucine-responsive regulatory protein
MFKASIFLSSYELFLAIYLLNALLNRGIHYNRFIIQSLPARMTDTLDKVDRAILAAVQADGRISNAKLAEVVGLSETPCARRLKRLENDGYIERYRAMLSRSALGLGVVAFVYVRFAVHDRAVATRFEREVLAIPRILSCHNVSGSADYVLQVVARDLDDYGTFMRDELRSLPGVTSVESSLSLREIKANGGLPLP